MKKSLKLLGIVLTAAVAIAALSQTEAFAKITGYLYGHALVIESVPGTTVASIGTAGALTVTSIANSGALTATTISGTTISGTTLTATGGAIQLYSRTQAQIEATTPTAVGQMYYCNNCTATTVCVSSAAAVMSWVSMVAPATACD